MPAKPNYLVDGAKWLRNQAVEQFSRLKMGTTGLWDNWQACRVIKKNIKAGSPMSYLDYTMLTRSKEDTSKVVTMLLIYVFLPEAVPFLLTFLPSAIPSTFETEDDRGRRFAAYDALRLRAALGAIDDVNKECASRKPERQKEFGVYRRALERTLAAGSKRDAFEQLTAAYTYAAPPPPAPVAAVAAPAAAAAAGGKADVAAAPAQPPPSQATAGGATVSAGPARPTGPAIGGPGPVLLVADKTTADATDAPAMAAMAEAGVPPAGDGTAAAAAGRAAAMVATAAVRPPKPPTTVEGLPKPFVKGLGRALGLCPPLTPAFLVRGQLRKHLKMLAESDAILNEQPLRDLSGWDLRDACTRRGITTDATPAYMRGRLEEWLAWTSAPPAGRPAGPVDSGWAPIAGAGSGGEWVAGRAKLVLLALNVASSVRASREADLSRLLLSGP